MAYGDQFFVGTSLDPKSKSDFATEEKQPEKKYGDEFFTDTSLDETKEPDSLVNAKKLMGSPDEDYRGFCQRFAEYAAFGKKDITESAIKFWNDAPEKTEGFKGLKKGDLIYFDKHRSNKGFGHVGVYEGNGNFISATDSGIESQSLDSWVNKTGQRPLGYIPV